MPFHGAVKLINSAQTLTLKTAAQVGQEFHEEAPEHHLLPPPHTHAQMMYARLVL